MPVEHPPEQPVGHARLAVADASRDDPARFGDLQATGIAIGTASTLLTKLATSGEVAKAERGYKLPD